MLAEVALAGGVDQAPVVDIRQLDVDLDDVFICGSGGYQRPQGHIPPPLYRCAFKNDRTCRTATGTRSFGSFQGNIVTSEFGANITVSIATA